MPWIFFSIFLPYRIFRTIGKCPSFSMRCICDLVIFAFTRPIHNVFFHRNVASMPTGVHLESQYGYYFYILFLLLRRLAENTFLNALIHFKKDRCYQCLGKVLLHVWEPLPQHFMRTRKENCLRFVTFWFLNELSESQRIVRDHPSQPSTHHQKNKSGVFQGIPNFFGPKHSQGILKLTYSSHVPS